MNKTQNTLENKAKFMALYWGQKVMRSSINDKDFTDLLITTIIPETMKDNWFLELTPLSQMTDEDAKRLIALKFLYDKGELEDIISINVNVSVKNTLRERNKVSIEAIIEHKRWNDFVERIFISEDSRTNFALVDCLRSKGYALPWMDLSVEDLVSYGWVKIKS